MIIGDRLGLYRALAAGGAHDLGRAGPAHADTRALRARVAERARRIGLRELPRRHGPLRADARTGDDVRRRRQPRLHRWAGSRSRCPPVASSTGSPTRSHSGEGIGWHEHDHGVFHGCARFFRPWYIAHLVQDWIPALDGVEGAARGRHPGRRRRLRTRHSTIIMAQAFPNSRFVGFDYHKESIDAAREARARGRRRRSLHASKWAARRTIPVIVRLRDRVRCAARHGRSGRLRAPRAFDARAEWHLDDRGALCGRSRRGEPEPDRARVLRGFDADVHALLAVAGRRTGARRAGGRSAAAQRGHGSGIPPLPARSAPRR